MTEPDFYADNAEWYAALVKPMLPGIRAGLTRLLPEPLPSGAAVEVGAGIGATLDVLARSGAQRIWAIEPSQAMRTGLLTRVALDPELTDITTILPGTLADTAHHLPAQWSALVILNAIGHLAPAEQEQLWRAIDAHLVPGGRVVVGLQPPYEPADIDWTEFGSSTVGEHTWRTLGKAVVSGPDCVDWTMEWTLTDDAGRQLDQRRATSHWRICSPERLTTQAEALGLVPSGGEPDLGMYGFLRP